MDKERKRGRTFGKPAILYTVLVFLMLLPVTSTATIISIGEVTVSPGESVTLPIMITNVTDCGVAAIQFSYDPSVVQVTAVKDSQFDVCDPTIDNVDGDFEIPAVQFWSDGLNGNVRLAMVTLEAVGAEGQWSFLNLTINEFKVVGPPAEMIPATVDNGKVILVESSQTSTTGATTTPSVSPSESSISPTPTVGVGATPAVGVGVTPTRSPGTTLGATPTPTPEEPGFGAMFAIAGLLAVAYVVLRRKQ